MPSKRRNAVDPLQLVAGDSVVHEQHGIGRFVELIQRKVAGGGRCRACANTWCWSTRRPSAARRGTGCLSPPTSWTR